MRRVGSLAFGVGIGLGPLRLAAAETKNKDVGDKLQEQILRLARQLGATEFKTRKAATIRLIAIGRGAGKDKRRDEEARRLVLATMKPLLKAKDPEVAQRAREITVALTSKPPANDRGPLHDDVEVLGVWE